jgi:hypothetical protein
MGPASKKAGPWRTLMRAPKRVLSKWVGEGYHSAKGRLFELRKWVIILNKPSHSCEPKLLNIEAAELVGDCLGEWFASLQRAVNTAF